MSKPGLWLNAVITLLGLIAFASLAGVFGYKWLASDEPNRSSTCGSGSRGGACFSGETTNMVLTFVFAGILLIGIVLCVMTVRSHRRTERERHRSQGSSRGFTVVHGRGNPIEYTFAPGTPGLSDVLGASVDTPVVGDPPPSAAMRLQQLEILRAAGAISNADYLRQREQVISEI